MVDAKATDNNIIWKHPATTKAEAKVGKEQKEDEPTRMARKFTRKVCRLKFSRALSWYTDPLDVCTLD
jgi:hypothetical protein